MNAQLKNSALRNFSRLAMLLILGVAFILGCSKQQTSTTAQIHQAAFANPEEAAKALQTAVRAKDEKAITQILGPKAKTLVSSGDPAEDTAAADSFLKKYDRMNRWVTMTDGSQMLYIGADNYPFPIPLAQDASSKWYFNAATGENELRARRLGRNELLAMDACRLIANAEELYHQGAHRYTDTIISTPGKQDGLYWEVAEGQALSPLGRHNELARGIFNSGAPSKTAILNGYSFRVLTSQAGFTIVATPVDYRHSGIMTFIQSHEGVLYQRDLGAQTTDSAASIEADNPTTNWTQAE